MRKLAFLSVFILGGLIADASWAKCQPTVCNNDGDTGKGWSVIDTNGNRGNSASGQCYRCNWGDNAYECDENTTIAIFDPDYATNNKVKGIYYCSDSGDYDDDWVEFSPSSTCAASEITKAGYDADPSKAEKFFSVTNGQPTNGNAGIVSGTDVGCVMYKCKSPYSPKPDKSGCIDASLNANCRAHNGSTYANGHSLNIRCTESSLPISSGLSSTAHLVNDAVCTGTCETNGWNITLKNDSCDSTYEPDSNKKKCVENAATRQQRRQRQENASKQEKCEESGGTWASNRCTCDAAKNLRLEAGECKCLDEVNYKRSADGKSCELTDAAALQRKCEAAGSAGAVWDGTKCTCSDAKKIWNGSTCIANPNIANCEAIPGAKWSNGECKCKDEDKEMNEDGTECVETEEARKRREEALKKAEQDAAKARITSITGKLNSLKAGLGTSVWKNKEGNFNTSRLVSDSVAGVVLGTAGGLITSNVIKKNQIKGGFEDINCTVRGQVVAGYGDDFQVGIQ